MKALLVIAVLAVVGGLFAYSSMQQKSMSPDTANTMTQEDSQTVGSGATVEIKGAKHSPNVLTVKPGEVVTVTNADIAGHSVTSDATGLFDTGIVANGESMTFVAPTTPGSYPYHCIAHPSMTGTLVVAE